MRKLRNKAIILLLLFILILVITACTGGDSNAKQNLQVEEVSQVKQVRESKNSKEPYYKLSNEQKKKVHLVVTVIREDLDSGEKRVTRIEKYDKQDRLLSEIDKNEKGKVTGYERYKYGNDGIIIEETRSRSMLGGGIMGITKFYIYDDQGRKTGYIAKNEWGNKCGEGVYKYYENGNLKYKYTNDQYRSREKEFYYNKQGEKIKAIDDVDGIFELHAVSHFKREYDEQGRKIKETEIREIDGQFGKKTAEITTYYNKFGESKKYIERVNGEIETWFEREYDENGNEIKFVPKNNEGNLERLRKYSYDKNNNNIEEIHMDIFKNGVQRKGLWIEREYDNKGNIIKSIYKGLDGRANIIYHYKRRITK